jgi:hypothetical protein
LILHKFVTESLVTGMLLQVDEEMRTLLANLKELVAAEAAAKAGKKAKKKKGGKKGGGKKGAGGKKAKGGKGKKKKDPTVRRAC